MADILFITRQLEKLKRVQTRMDKADLGVSLERADYPAAENQSLSLKDMALGRARGAYKRYRKPILVEENGFYIDELQGFPGPFVHYVMSTLGLNGILSALQNHENRSARFVSVVVFVDQAGEEHVIIDDQSSKGKISQIPAEKNEQLPSDLWRIFMPDGYDKPVATMTPSELSEYMAKRGELSAMNQMIEHMPTLLEKIKTMSKDIEMSR